MTYDQLTLKTESNLLKGLKQTVSGSGVCIRAACRQGKNGLFIAHNIIKGRKKGTIIWYQYCGEMLHIRSLTPGRSDTGRYVSGGGRVVEVSIWRNAKYRDREKKRSMIAITCVNKCMKMESTVCEKKKHLKCVGQIIGRFPLKWWVYDREYSIDHGCDLKHGRIGD